MNRQISRTVFAATLAAITFAPIAAQAAPFKKADPDTKSAQKKPGKNIHMTVRNDSDETRELKVGDEIVTVAAKSSTKIEAPEGTRVYNNTKTAKVEAGTLMVQISKDLNNATLALN